ncbi:MAG: GC-type dockerin domain-anchored protein [Phycisphaerales bacterium]
MRTESRASLALLLAVCGLACSSAKAQDIIAGPFSRGSSQYYLTSLTSWASAEALAVSMGGHLVTIETQAENDWLGTTFQPLLTTYTGGPWIGLHGGGGASGTWSWVSGSSSTFRFWDADEPNNLCGNETVVHFHWGAGSAWNDIADDPNDQCASGTLPLNGIIETACTTNSTVNWTNAQGGSWDVESNWDPEGRPDSSVIATFSLDEQYIVTLPVDREIAGVVVNAGFVYFSFGTSQLGPPSAGCRPDFTLVTSPDISSSSNLMVTGGWLTSDGLTSIAAGESSSSNLGVLAGGKMDATRDLLLGRGNDSTATLLLEDGELRFSSNLSVGAGTRATGTITINNDGMLTGPRSSTRVYLGDAQGDGNVTTGIVNLNAGGLLRTGELVLGRRPATSGRLYLNGGLLQVDSLVISDEGAGLLDWTGGTIESLRSLIIAKGSGSEGQLNLDGAGRSLVFTGAGGVAHIAVGDQGHGTLRVENGADISLAAGELQALEIGAHPSARGHVLVDGAESSIYGSADASTDSSILVVGNAFGIDGTLVVDNGGIVTFGHVLCGSNIGAPGGGIIVRNYSYLTSRGLGDAFSTPATGLRVGNAEGTAFMRVLLGGTVTANSAIFMGTDDSGPVVTVENADSVLDVKETLYLVDYGGTTAVPELKVRGGGLLKTHDAYIGTGMGSASSSGIVTLEGPGIVWESSGTINVGDPTDVNAVGTLNLVNNAEVQTHWFHPGATTHITGGATGNPLIHVGSNRANADITCDTLLMSPQTDLGALNLTMGVGAGIGGNGTWPGDFTASFGGEVVAEQAVCLFYEGSGFVSDFTIAGSLSMDASASVQAACGYLFDQTYGEYHQPIHSRLVVQGTAAIDGTLRIGQWNRDLIAFGNPFGAAALTIGSTYEVLSASSIVGTFDELVLAPDFVSNRAHLTYEPNRVLVTIDPPVCNPAITDQPVGGQTSPGGTMTITTGATTEFGDLEYRWEWLNVANDNAWQEVTDGMSNSVLSAAVVSPGTIQVTVDPAYFYHGFPLPNELRLRCFVHALKCNEWLQSANVVLIVCGADVNHDGFVNGDDYDSFAEGFESADPSADFNRDGFVNGDDYDAFAEHFEVGC